MKHYYVHSFLQGCFVAHGLTSLGFCPAFGLILAIGMSVWGIKSAIDMVSDDLNY